MESSHYADLILSSRVSLSYIAPSNVFTPTKALNAELRAATWRCSPLVITKTGNAYRYFRVIWMLVYFHLYTGLSRITVIQIHGYSVQQSAPYYPI